VSGGQLRPSMRMIYADLAADCREAIGDDAWAAALAEGRGRPFEQAVAAALAVLAVAPGALL
jgi:hypothetical protein